MSRILLTWELGLNLGHLTRLLPIAQQLKSEGHVVLVAARDIQAAATVLTPAGIAFVQAPHLPNGIALAHRPSGYADILLSQGWSNGPSLRGLTHAWLNLLRLFNPERLILDYSPTVSLATRIANLPTVLVGNGFEIPPATAPLPPFPGFSWANAAEAAQSEAIAVGNANRVLSVYGGGQIASLSDLVADQTRLLATFAQLDHYGERADALYIGPLLGALKAPRIDWPAGSGPRIFACLRPDTSQVDTILAALAGMTARVICVCAGFAASRLSAFMRPHIAFSSGPVDLSALEAADLCLTYGAEGTLLRFLLMGVPHLVSPWHVETYMAARRIEAAGLGTAIPAGATPQSIAELVEIWTGDAQRERVKAFAQRSSGMELARIVSIALARSTVQPFTPLRATA